MGRGIKKEINKDVNETSKEKAKSLFANETRSLVGIYNDWVFKYIYGRGVPESDKALTALLNVILERDDDPIVGVTVRNPIVLGETMEQKDSYLDIRAETNSGEQIEIEMQNERLEYYTNRSIYYAGKLINLALDKGKNYDKMKKSIVISIIKGKLFNESCEIHSTFRPMEVKHHFELTDKLEWHFVEVDKLDEDKAISDMDSIERFSAYMKWAADRTKEDKLTKLLNCKTEVVTVTEHIFKEMTEDEKLRERLEDQERREHAIATIEYVAEKRGLTQGLEQGLTQAHKEKCDIAKSLKDIEMSIEKISEITKLPVEEIEAL